MWKWDQSAGELTRDGKFICRGYAGYEKGKNNPFLEGAPGVGPIPRGKWKIGPPRDSANTGRYTLNLDPLPGTDALGRSLFRIHGDSIAKPGTASHGCIIVARAIRKAIWESGDHVIEVVA